MPSFLLWIVTIVWDFYGFVDGKVSLTMVLLGSRPAEAAYNEGSRSVAILAHVSRESTCRLESAFIAPRSTCHLKAVADPSRWRLLSTATARFVGETIYHSPDACEAPQKPKSFEIRFERMLLHGRSLSIRNVLGVLTASLRSVDQKAFPSTAECSCGKNLCLHLEVDV